MKVLAGLFYTGAFAAVITGLVKMSNDRYVLSTMRSVGPDYTAVICWFLLAVIGAIVASGILISSNITDLQKALKTSKDGE